MRGDDHLRGRRRGLDRDRTLARVLTRRLRHRLHPVPWAVRQTGVQGQGGQVRADERAAGAAELGELEGKAAASWVFDGNTTEETYRDFLKGIEDGDPMVLNMLPSSDLSGEWAGATTPSELGVSADDD